VLANYLIGLREGLEAALIVSILLAYLTRTGHAAQRRWVWLGVALAATVSVLFGLFLTFVSDELSEHAEIIFSGVTSLVAVGFVTWMIFWMKRTARSIKGELEGRMAEALAVGAGALATLAFLAVAREGLETALFVWTTTRSNGDPATAFGVVLGIATAVVIGVLLYRGALRINLGTFFRVTGVLLVFVAAGVLTYGLHEFQEIGWLPGFDTIAFDVTGALPESSVLYALLHGLFSFSGDPTWLMVVAWIAYVVIVLGFFLHQPKKAAPRPTPAASNAPSTPNTAA
jgi:high-affinity iron transporter